jgi:hypothetical protein
MTNLMKTHDPLAREHMIGFRAFLKTGLSKKMIPDQAEHRRELSK